MASHLFDFLLHKSDYFDAKSGLNREEYFAKLKVTKILYVGNLAITTPEWKIYQLFSRCGHIKRVNMGLNN